MLLAYFAFSCRKNDMHITSGKWSDGTWWEVDLPDDREVIEQSSDHLVLSGEGASLLIGLRKSVICARASTTLPWLRAKAGLTASEADICELAYTQANMRVWWPFFLLGRWWPVFSRRLERMESGSLVGYVSRANIDGPKIRWAGYFTSGDWYVYVRLEATSIRLRSSIEVTTNILASMTFQE